MTIKHPFNNKSYILEAITITKTYGSWLEGKPNRERNEEIVKSTKYPKAWGKRKYLLLKPSDQELNTKLPSYTFTIWLTGSPLSVENDGSEIVVTWFDQDQETISIETLITSALLKFDWDEHAVDFQY